MIAFDECVLVAGKDEKEAAWRDCISAEKMAGDSKFASRFRPYC